MDVEKCQEMNCRNLGRINSTVVYSSAMGLRLQEQGIHTDCVTKTVTSGTFIAQLF
jgi:hypothetical protein